MRCDYPSCIVCPKAGIQTNPTAPNFDAFVECANNRVAVPSDIEREAREQLKARLRKRR